MPIITWWVTIYKNEYCVNYLSGTSFETCDQWLTISSMEISDIKEIWTSILFNGWIMIASIFIVLYLVKWIFKKLF